uniref:UvrD-like helicase ATP-binding domain-containing protein n=1 Tax=Chromera velia CCMP2878 TaxID=1169474 RepID=A0A0K6S7Q9_9ALVE|eukprot:Cvel_21884.t1-p1 / transcript=Cvel_21884.t1 / gene=Cvel_21884 / organism=Chromera_velia_CCMP2878 / gene_product=TPR and ankyrin repeat-containing protein 1, putative / transcript_product=TPR and ankyrin repeat-containing protein 1, putative / location=Cvel_scaffold2093:7933-20568(+) / protein_length=2331 / sequence_SO=supercontig / SO=protein_coding / is_pseudo=false
MAETDGSEGKPWNLVVSHAFRNRLSLVPPEKLQVLAKVIERMTNRERLDRKGSNAAAGQEREAPLWARAGEVSELGKDSFLVWWVRLRFQQHLGGSWQVLSLFDIVRKEELPGTKKRLEKFLSTRSDNFLTASLKRKVVCLQGGKILCLPLFIPASDLSLDTFQRQMTVDGGKEIPVREEVEKAGDSVGLMKHYSLPSAFLDLFASGGLSLDEGTTGRLSGVADIPIELTPEEEALVTKPGPNFILGRSGTGKMLTLLARMVIVRQGINRLRQEEAASRLAEADKDGNPPRASAGTGGDTPTQSASSSASASVSEQSQPRRVQVFVTTSSRLKGQIGLQFSKLVRAFEATLQTSKQTMQSERGGVGEGTGRGEATSMGAADLLGGGDEEGVDGETAPLISEAPDGSALFFSSRQLLSALDCELPPKLQFFSHEKRVDRLRRQARRAQEAVQATREVVVDADEVPDACRSSRGYRWEELVTFVVFVEVYWPSLQKTMTRRQDRESPLLVFKEIMTVIKGHPLVLTSQNNLRNHLTEDEYVCAQNMRESFVGGDNCARRRVFGLFVKYEELRRHRGEFDLVDVCQHLYRNLEQSRLFGSGQKGGKDVEIVGFMVDEVQDFLPSQLMLWARLPAHPTAFSFAGDTAQTIARGTEFRFQRVKQLFHDHFCPPGMREQDREAVRRGLREAVSHLTQNFRSANGVLDLAASLVTSLEILFPGKIDRMPREESLQVVASGGRPVVFCGIPYRSVIKTMFGQKGQEYNKDGEDKEEEEEKSQMLGANQCILTSNEKTRDLVRHRFPKSLVLTIEESKGLEFDDVLLLHFFPDAHEIFVCDRKHPTGGGGVGTGVRSLLNDRASAQQEAAVEMMLLNNAHCDALWEAIAVKVQPSFDVRRRETANGSRKSQNLSTTAAVRAQVLQQHVDANRSELLCTFLKELYVAVTRARHRVWIADVHGNLRPFLEIWEQKRLATAIWKTADCAKLGKETFVKASNAVEWDSRGLDFLNQDQFGSAELAFRNADNELMRKICQARKAAARGRAGETEEQRESLREAASICRDLLLRDELFWACSARGLSAVSRRSVLQEMAAFQERAGDLEGAALSFRELEDFLKEADCWEAAERIAEAAEARNRAADLSAALELFRPCSSSFEAALDFSESLVARRLGGKRPDGGISEGAEMETERFGVRRFARRACRRLKMQEGNGDGEKHTNQVIRRVVRLLPSERESVSVLRSLGRFELLLQFLEERERYPEAIQCALSLGEWGVARRLVAAAFNEFHQLTNEDALENFNHFPGGLEGVRSAKAFLSPFEAFVRNPTEEAVSLLLSEFRKQRAVFEEDGGRGSGALGELWSVFLEVEVAARWALLLVGKFVALSLLVKQRTHRELWGGWSSFQRSFELASVLLRDPVDPAESVPDDAETDVPCLAALIRSGVSHRREGDAGERRGADASSLGSRNDVGEVRRMAAHVLFGFVPLEGAREGESDRFVILSGGFLFQLGVREAEVGGQKSPFVAVSQMSAVLETVASAICALHTSLEKLLLEASLRVSRSVVPCWSALVEGMCSSEGEGGPRGVCGRRHREEGGASLREVEEMVASMVVWADSLRKRILKEHVQRALRSFEIAGLVMRGGDGDVALPSLHGLGDPLSLPVEEGSLVLCSNALNEAVRDFFFPLVPSVAPLPLVAAYRGETCGRRNRLHERGGRGAEGDLIHRALSAHVQRHLACLEQAGRERFLNVSLQILTLTSLHPMYSESETGEGAETTQTSPPVFLGLDDLLSFSRQMAQESQQEGEGEGVESSRRGSTEAEKIAHDILQSFASEQAALRAETPEQSHERLVDALKSSHKVVEALRASAEEELWKTLSPDVLTRLLERQVVWCSALVTQLCDLILPLSMLVQHFKGKELLIAACTHPDVKADAYRTALESLESVSRLTFKIVCSEKGRSASEWLTMHKAHRGVTLTRLLTVGLCTGTPNVDRAVHEILFGIKRDTMVWGGVRKLLRKRVRPQSGEASSTGCREPLHESNRSTEETQPEGSALHDRVPTSLATLVLACPKPMGDTYLELPALSAVLEDLGDPLIFIHRQGEGTEPEMQTENESGRTGKWNASALLRFDLSGVPETRTEASVLTSWLTAEGRRLAGREDEEDEVVVSRDGQRDAEGGMVRMDSTDEGSEGVSQRAGDANRETEERQNPSVTVEASAQDILDGLARQRTDIQEWLQKAEIPHEDPVSQLFLSVLLPTHQLAQHLIAERRLLKEKTEGVLNWIWTKVGAVALLSQEGGDKGVSGVGMTVKEARACEETLQDAVEMIEEVLDLLEALSVLLALPSKERTVEGGGGTV